jgi:hypothetical protein
MRHDANENPLLAVGRDAENEARSNLGGEPKIDEPDLATRRNLH